MIFSCKKNSGYDTDFNSINYDDAIKKAAEYLENQKKNNLKNHSLICNRGNRGGDEDGVRKILVGKAKEGENRGDDIFEFPPPQKKS